MRKPDFFIAGAPRCGTTALYTYLSEHPNIFMSEVKELNYFASDFPGVQKIAFNSDDDYLKVFSSAGDNHQAVGEASPFYLYSEHAFNNILAFNPRSKIILTLRSPVQFVQSFHRLNLSLLREDEEDLEKAWNLQEERSLGRHIPSSSREPQLILYGELGQFGKHVKKLYEIFPAEQILVIIFEDFILQPQVIYDRILDFLQVPSDDRTEFPAINANFSNRSRLLAKLFHPPQFIYQGFMKFIGLFGVDFMKSISVVYNKIEKLNTTTTKRKPLDPKFKAKLQSYFREDVALLSEIIARDLSSWLD